MPQEIRFATFNVYNLAPPGAKLYDNLLPLTAAEYEAKLDWTARQLDLLDADVIGFQEVFAQPVLDQVLARTRRYRAAQHAGFDADPGNGRLTPGVALVSRLPLAGPAVEYPAFPAGVTLPPGSGDGDCFARPVLHARIVLPDRAIAEVLVVHLKSRRPDYRNGACSTEALPHALANLRSLIRRGTEAVALRVLLSGLPRGAPRVVLGDFNDVANSVTTAIVLGTASCLPGQEWAERLFDSQQIQLRQDQLRYAGYSNIHDGHCMTIDHILVSEEFHPASPRAIGEVLDVICLNDHLLQARPEVSDHGQVVARVRLYGAGEPAGGA